MAPKGKAATVGMSVCPREGTEKRCGSFFFKLHCIHTLHTTFSDAIMIWWHPWLAETDCYSHDFRHLFDCCRVYFMNYCWGCQERKIREVARQFPYSRAYISTSKLCFMVLSTLVSQGRPPRLSLLLALTSVVWLVTSGYQTLVQASPTSVGQLR